MSTKLAPQPDYGSDYYLRKTPIPAVLEAGVWLLAAPPSSQVARRTGVFLHRRNFVKSGCETNRVERPARLLSLRLPRDDVPSSNRLRGEEQEQGRQLVGG